MLAYQEYIVIEKRWEIPDTFILKLKPKDSRVPNFKPGQYVVIKNPTYKNKSEEHIFSIASAPQNNQYIELCVKIFGDWTKYLSKIVKRDSLFVSNPNGKFVWDSSIKQAVFLVGGIGITPVVSMLRYIHESHEKPEITLLYGSQSPEKTAFKQQLQVLSKSLNLKIVHIFSDKILVTPPNFQGFITKEIIQKETDLSKKPTFFYCGPDLFIKHIQKILHELNISQEFIRTELLQ